MGHRMASSELEHPVVWCGAVWCCVVPFSSHRTGDQMGTHHPYQHQPGPCPTCLQMPPALQGTTGHPRDHDGDTWHVPCWHGAAGTRRQVALGLLDRGRPQQDAATHSLGLVWLCGKLYFHTNVFGFFFSSHYKLNSSNSLQGEICFSLLCKGTAASFS